MRSAECRLQARKVQGWRVGDFSESEVGLGPSVNLLSQIPNLILF